MTFTVALLILAFGILIGFHLPGPMARLKTRYRAYRYRLQVLRPWQPNPSGPSERHE